MNINFKRPQLGFAALGIAAAMAVGMGEVRADPIVAQGVFTSDHCTDNCQVSPTSPGALLTVTDQGGGVLDFLIQTAPNYLIVHTGFGFSFGFNLVNDATITFSSIVPAFPDPSYDIPGGNPQATQAASNATKVDGFGFFEHGLVFQGNGGNQGTTSLAFTITGPGLSIADLLDFADLPGANGTDAGPLMALDVAFTSPSGAVITGPIDLSVGPTPRQQCFPGPCTTDVPEPASLALFGTALVGLGLLTRWRNRGSKTDAV